MKIRIIDANSIGYAQHHKQPMRQVAGKEFQAVLGTLDHIRRQIQYDPSTLVIVIWDGLAQWRFDLYPEYKSSRMKALEQQISRAAYEAQKPFIVEALKHYPVIQLKHPNAEADDVAFGLAMQLAVLGHDVSLSTADTDWLQIVGPNVRWLNARKYGHVVSDADFANTCDFSHPAMVAQVKALAGDVSDDIIGVANVGPKRAQYLLAKYGGLEEVLSLAQFEAFSAESVYFHALHKDEVQSRVRMNWSLVDLSKGPALEGIDVHMIRGEFSPLELAGCFTDWQFSEFLSEWRYWDKALSSGMPEGAVDVVKDSLSLLSFSWNA